MSLFGGLWSIATNNQLPATHFIEVWKGGTQKIHNSSMEEIKYLSNCLHATKVLCYKTIAIFRIRENKLPTNVEGSVLENLEKLIA